jgi:cupin 2 domain-containing protein
VTGRRPNPYLEAILIKSGDLLADAPRRSAEEITSVIAQTPGARIERIVSAGQASPPGFWYDQNWTEWVFLISGSAGLLIEGEKAPRVLRPGGYVELPAHMRHRVEWTDADQPTVWLAVHLAG